MRGLLGSKKYFLTERSIFPFPFEFQKYISRMLFKMESNGTPNFPKQKINLCLKHLVCKHEFMGEI